jgi:hypothetical protein
MLKLEYGTGCSSCIRNKKVEEVYNKLSQPEILEILSFGPVCLQCIRNKITIEDMQKLSQPKNPCEYCLTYSMSPCSPSNPNCRRKPSQSKGNPNGCASCNIHLNGGYICVNVSSDCHNRQSQSGPKLCDCGKCTKPPEKSQAIRIGLAIHSYHDVKDMHSKGQYNAYYLVRDVHNWLDYQKSLGIYLNKSKKKIFSKMATNTLLRIINIFIETTEGSSKREYQELRNYIKEDLL